MNLLETDSSPAFDASLPLRSATPRAGSPLGSLPHDHVLQFYESDELLHETVADFLAAGLRAGEPVVVIATAPHRAGFLRRLDQSGLDSAGARARGELVLLDAEETLSKLLVDGMPEGDLFREHVGGLIEGLFAGGRHARVRAYGEMVDVLWRRGSTTAALRLEELWNELAQVHPFSLLCAYVMGSFYKSDQASQLKEICRAHTRVVPVTTDCHVGDEHLRDVSLLLQHAHALERELEHRKELERALRESLEERRRAEEALRSANQVKDEFLAVVSHELRTPLAAIAGWAAILKSAGRQDAATLAKGLDVIDRNAKAQSRLIEDLLDVSRIMAGTLAVDLRPVSLVTVVSEAVESLKASASAKEVGLMFHGSIDSYSIVGDPHRLRQVVCNLLTNAIKFTPKGGRVDVRLRRHLGSVLIEVEDTGKGIDPELLPYVFERFRQGRSSMTRRQGLGLGLAIVRHLVELHGGKVTAGSAGLGKGATFSVTFPVAAVFTSTDRGDDDDDEGGSHDVFPTPEVAVSLSGLRVLLVDDEEDARDLVKDVLSSLGAEVLAAASAREGLDLMVGFRPDVVVSDIGMPDQDGYAFIRSVRQLASPFREVPAVALTAYAHPNEAVEAVEAGFQSHIPKPTDQVTLASAITRARGR